ncbi:hypothetical protein [Mycobacterium sp. SMC-11]|uniref:hypothetical protein n=1 Tax=Mycobacterium sp. SMC-11 TaxID=3385969 RepID=UPI00390C6BED
MTEELARQWDVVRDVVRRYTGPLAVLRDDCTGAYFDQYTERLAGNLDRDPRVCVMAVDSGLVFWLRSLLTGRFRKAIGVRLYGTAGPRRDTKEKSPTCVSSVTSPRRR